jgi:hypothetical protein
LAGNLILKGLKNSPEDTTETKILGITVNTGSTLTMDGGTISGFDSSGVKVSGSNSTFIMYDGTISGNSTPTSSGGVYVAGYGKFTMYNGIISGNSASQGGGVGVAAFGTFTMYDGTISDNSASHGGGVAVGNPSTFTMYGGEISGNSSTSRGGGVSVQGGATFIMEDGEISGNSTSGSGGGVSVQSSAMFTMTGGEIGGNTALDSGGGVFINVVPAENYPIEDSKFAKIGDGIIYGSNEIEENIRNLVKDSSGDPVDNKGHAVYIDSNHYKENTVGENDNLYFNAPDTSDFGWD